MQHSQAQAPVKLKILAVDDDLALLDLVASDIESLGFVPLLATSMAEALTKAALYGREIAAIISDLNMPGGSGLELRRDLPRELQEIPFIVLSGFISQELALRGLELKIVAFLSKPYKADDFQTIVGREAAPRVESIRERAMLEQTFFGEAASILEELEPLILTLERAPQDVNTINAIFRYVHTLKGSAGILEAEVFTKFAHALEDHLSRYKAGTAPLTPDAIALLLRGYDTIKTLLAALEQRDGSKFDLQELLANLNGSGLSPSGPADQQQAARAAAPGQEAHAPVKQEAIKVPTQTLDELMALSGEITVLRNMVNKLVRSVEKASPGNKDVGLLAQLFEEMNKTNSAMQQKIADMRQMPMQTVLKPMARLVRDLAKGLGKGLTLNIKGEDLRIDHSVSQVLTDSLVHLVRNSADHGIEDKAARRAAGKTEAGRVLIDCRQDREDIVVEVSDDGRGIDAQKIRQKVVTMGLMSADEAARLSERDVLLHIFAPGFSTAAKVTEVSGRGVGMDMVATSVKKLGGRIDLTTKLGEGTNFSLRLPIPKSVLIINSLLVASRGQTFALHQEHLIRLLRLDIEQQKQISLVEGGAVLMVDQETYPVVHLEQLLWPGTELRSRIDDRDFLNILLLRCNGMSFALLVDDILDGEEIVVKPVGKHLENLQAFAGATFLGDGTVALILSVEGLGRLAGQVALSRDALASAAKTAEKAPSGSRYVAFMLERPGLYAAPLADIFRVEKVSRSSLQKNGNLLNLPYRHKIMVVYDALQLLQPDAVPGKRPAEPTVRTAAQSAAQLADSNELLTLIVMLEGGRFFGFIVSGVADVATVHEVSPTNTLISATKRRQSAGQAPNAEHIFIDGEPASIVDFKEILRRRGDLLPEPPQNVRPLPVLAPAPGLGQKAEVATAAPVLALAAEALVPPVAEASSLPAAAEPETAAAGWGLFDQPTSAAAGWGLFD